MIFSVPFFTFFRVPIFINAHLTPTILTVFISSKFVEFTFRLIDFTFCTFFHMFKINACITHVCIMLQNLIKSSKKRELHDIRGHETKKA